jgi:acetyl esterase/lipase
MREYVAVHVSDQSQRNLPIYSTAFGDLTKCPAIVIMAPFDLLRDETRALAKTLEESGVSVSYYCIQGTIHEFLFRSDLKDVQQGAYTGLNAFRKLLQSQMK